MNGTPPQLEDMRLFAAVAAHRSFTAAGRQLSIPKQTVSRRIALLERALGVQLLRRTTRAVETTEAGALYAAHCTELVRLAEDANREVLHAHASPRGLLRVTADPLFGETFLSPLLCSYARRHPDVRLEVMLTRRHVDLVEEGYDVAFRIGEPRDAALHAERLGPARVRYVASRRYLRARGAPATPDDLAAHDCIVVGAPAEVIGWPFRQRGRARTIAVSGRLRLSSFAMARDAARAGLGITIAPEFASEADIQGGRLSSLLEPFLPEIGSVLLVYPTQRFLSARVRAFVDLAIETFAERPWVPRRRR